MAVDHFLVCDECRSAWQFFRSQAGGFAVDPSLVHRPGDFWRWMSQHKPHGIRVTDDSENAIMDYDTADIPTERPY
jgi:hypothetical protein